VADSGITYQKSIIFLSLSVCLFCSYNCLMLGTVFFVPWLNAYIVM
jgi:hypothetical protein